MQRSRELGVRKRLVDRQSFCLFSNAAASQIAASVKPLIKKMSRKRFSQPVNRLLWR
jgi:hypothetical protein